MSDSRRASATRSRPGRAGSNPLPHARNSIGAIAGDFEKQYNAALRRQDWDEARRRLEAGAEALDPFACGQLGIWRLLGHVVDRDDAEGFRLVRHAAREGEPGARRLLATLYARGRGVEANWPKAVEWLVRGAQGGDPDPMRQLAFLLPPSLAHEQRALLEAAARAGDLIARRKLARMPKSDAPSKQLAWTKIKRTARRPVLPEGVTELVREKPLIRLRRNMLSLDLCDYMICTAAPFLARALVNDAERGADLVDDTRTNRFASLWLLEGDVVTDSVDRMVARLVGAPTDTGEPISVLHYAPGEQYAPHFDFFDPEAPAHAVQFAADGQRVATCLIYLNAGYDGGATAFVDIGVEIRGEPGDALFWLNVETDGAPDRLTRHAGLPTTSGDKWLLSKWFRDRPQSHVRAPGPDH